MFGDGLPIGDVGPGASVVSSGDRGPTVVVTPGKSTGSLVMPPFEGRAVMTLCMKVSLRTNTEVEDQQYSCERWAYCQSSSLQ